MTWQIRDHGAFQRGGLLLVAVGGAVGLLCGLAMVGLPDALLVAAVGASALALALTETHPGSIVEAVGSPRCARSRLGRRRLALAVAGVLTGLALAWLCWSGLAGAHAWQFTLLEGTAAGALFGLVAALGLLPAHLGSVRRDRVAEALAQADLRFAGEPPGAEEATLVRRAAEAHARIRRGLDGPELAREAGSARRGGRTGGGEGEAARGGLRSEADALTLQVIELAGRCRELRLELGSVDQAELDGRGAALARAAEATADPAAREDFARAARTTSELHDRLRARRAAQDRLRARLSLQVTILESTALALSARSASSTAQAASALAPLAERVREAGADLEAEALALAETG
jgi:hypothetical protein